MMKLEKLPLEDEAKGRPTCFSDWERMQLKSLIPTQAPPKEFVVVSRLFQKLALSEEYGGSYTRESIQGVFGGSEKMMTLMRLFLEEMGSISKPFFQEKQRPLAFQIGLI